MSIFKPTGTSDALIKACQPHITSGKLLDLGCGCGIIGNSFKNCSVFASDIDYHSTEMVKRNYPNIETRCGSLFKPWENMKFDYIIDDVSGISKNLAKVSPWFRGVSCESGRDGADLVCKVISQSPKYLNDGGKLFFPIVSLSNKTRIYEEASRVFKSVKQISTEYFPLPREMYEYEDLMKYLKLRKYIDYKDAYGGIIFWTDIYIAQEGNGK